MQQEVWFNKYIILRLLGCGGYAKVYLAEHIKLNSYRVIKFISNNNPFYDLLRKEAFVLKNIQHPCIPTVYDIEEDESGTYIIEQYIEGETLKAYRNQQGPLSERVILRLGIQLCDLLNYLHSMERPLYYIDLKPDNLILSGDNLMLIDFGSAVFQDELTEHSHFHATKGYAAPELYGRNRIDERCDVFGIGMLLFFMATGEPSCSSDSMKNIDSVNGYTKQLKSIINHCIKFNPSQRYASVDKLKKQLSALLINQKDNMKSNQSQVIAVAGTQPRIGVTHFAFQVCNYLMHYGSICVYQEKNNSGVVNQIKNCYRNVIQQEGVIKVNGIYMAVPGCKEVPSINKGQTIVYDYGILSCDNLQEFLMADMKLLVLGAKDWELCYSEEVLSMLTEYKDIIYLFNFMNGKQFHQIIKSMEARPCYRLPYEPDPFAPITFDNGIDLFREILYIRPKRKLWERVRLLRRKEK